VLFPQVGQARIRGRPQPVHTFHPSFVGTLHRGQRRSRGLTLEQLGQNWESGGTSSPQYLQGFAYPLIKFDLYRWIYLFLVRAFVIMLCYRM